MLLELFLPCAENDMRSDNAMHSKLLPDCEAPENVAKNACLAVQRRSDGCHAMKKLGLVETLPCMGMIRKPSNSFHNVKNSVIVMSMSLM
jgi:hypothetical protein